MRNKILLGCSIIVMVLAVVLNFNAMLMGSTASLLNVIVTACFLGFWVAFIALARMSKRLLIYSVAIGGITLIAALLALVINVYAWDIPIALPLVAIFLTPLYGITAVLSGDFISASITMAVICTIWVVSSGTLLKRIK